MGRKLRFIPPGSLVEVTAKTIQGRFLLRPGPELNRRFVGVVARAKCAYDVKVHAVACLSNHHHMLVSPGDAQQLALFMNYVQGNLATEAGDLHDWEGPFWGRRYHAILVSDEPAAQYERLRYVLAQACKEGLVERPELWPGVHSVFALRDDEPLRGVWYDRTGLCLAGRRKSEPPDLEDFKSTETLELDPLPCWERQGISDEERQRIVAEMVEQIVEEAAAERVTKGIRPRDPSNFTRVHPHQRPEKTKLSPAPFVHAASKEVRVKFREAYRIFSEAFRAAAERLKAGRAGTAFPEGSFPPGLPFVPIPLLEPG